MEEICFQRLSILLRYNNRKGVTGLLPGDVHSQPLRFYKAYKADDGPLSPMRGVSRGDRPDAGVFNAGQDSDRKKKTVHVFLVEILWNSPFFWNAVKRAGKGRKGQRKAKKGEKPRKFERNCEQKPQF